MDHTVFAKVLDRHRIARKALARMRQETSLEAQEDEWFTFLRAWKGIYTCLEQAVKGDPKATMWFGQRNAFRRRDELLQYLYQARNDDEHGLTRTTQRNDGGVAIGRRIGPGPIKIGKLRVEIESGQMQVFEGGGHENMDMKIQVVPNHLTLTPVRDRDRKTVYNPPMTHQGKPFENGHNPVSVGQAAMDYMDELIGEAKAF